MSLPVGKNTKERKEVKWGKKSIAVELIMTVNVGGYGGEVNGGNS